MRNPEITKLLKEMHEGNPSVIDRVLPLVYDELRKLARRHLSKERAGHTLNTTALVHEAYLKLVGQDRTDWQSRGQFFAVASMAMRRILVNYARDRKRLKRGGDVSVLPLDAALTITSDEHADQILMIDRLLSRLSTLDKRAADVVECRFFGGLTVDETGEAIGLSPTTVKRAWRFAKSWLRREMLEKNADQ